MGMNTCTKERFLSDIENHSLKIISDDGVNRHISFTNNGSNIYRFDLITWPGALCITGDCGTYVFKRITDMFEFFRHDKINAGYWGQKLESIDNNGGFKEFSTDLFVECIKSDFEDWLFCNEKEKSKAWEDVEDKVLSYQDDGEFAAVNAAISYKSDDDNGFDDFFEHTLTEYTFHYLWCLEAIIYGIKEYDKASNKCNQG